MQLFRTKRNMKREKSTCLSQRKATLMLLHSCSLETSKLLINRTIFYSNQTSGTNMERGQTRTTKEIHQSKKSLKRGQGLALGRQMQKHSGL
jgi:phosphodiesterase/alkaline phosphatase D-like protein